MLSLIIWLGVAYLMGNLPSAKIVCKLFNLPDPESHGSNNPGTTNVLRLGGKLPAFLTLCGDFLKGFLPVFMARSAGFGLFAVGLVALAACLGHIFPLFNKFKGGKGVATAGGVFFGISAWIGLLIGSCWIIVAVIYRYSSLAALVAAAFAPVAMLLFGAPGAFLPILAISAILIFKHQDNIRRLRSGTEGKIKI